MIEITYVNLMALAGSYLALSSSFALNVVGIKSSLPELVGKIGACAFIVGTVGSLVEVIIKAVS